MRSATLTLTVEFVRAIDDKNIAGHGRFNNGKTLDSISFTAYAPRLRDTIVPGVTLVAEGNLRAIKDAAGITSLSLNITQAMQVAPADPVPAVEPEHNDIKLLAPTAESTNMPEAEAIDAELLDEQSPAETEQRIIEVEPVASAKPKSTRGRKPKVLATA
ncbi:MAG: hypothetical protein LH474_07470 [Chamaesiphon sp.]|nr:hypothetical protein [Chamaesiphon sp.]